MTDPRKPKDILDQNRMLFFFLLSAGTTTPYKLSCVGEASMGLMLSHLPQYSHISTSFQRGLFFEGLEDVDGLGGELVEPYPGETRSGPSLSDSEILDIKKMMKRQKGSGDVKAGNPPWVLPAVER